MVPTQFCCTCLLLLLLYLCPAGAVLLLLGSMCTYLWGSGSKPGWWQYAFSGVTGKLKLRHSAGGFSTALWQYTDLVPAHWACSFLFVRFEPTCHGHIISLTAFWYFFFPGIFGITITGNFESCVFLVFVFCISFLGVDVFNFVLILRWLEIFKQIISDRESHLLRNKKCFVTGFGLGFFS